jgi:hypothetical protein
MFLSFDLDFFFVILKRAKEPFGLLVKYKILKKKKVDGMCVARIRE